MRLHVRDRLAISHKLNEITRRLTSIDLLLPEEIRRFVRCGKGSIDDFTKIVKQMEEEDDKRNFISVVT